VSVRATDIAREVGLALATRTYGAVVFDYDNDGWPDVLIGRHSQPARLFRNERGYFVPVKAVTFPRGDRHGCVAGDINGDGRMDLYCTIGGRDGKLPKEIPNELWIQQKDGTFVNEGGHPGLADPYGRGRQAVLFDVNRNGRLDLFVANSSPRADGHTSQNRLFLNEGDAGWRPAPELGLDFELSCGSSGAGPPHGSLEAFDFDGDGWVDVLMCAKNERGGGNRGVQSTSLRLFRNENGRMFRDVTGDVGLAGEALDVAISDFDGDGHPDLVTVNSDGLSVLLYEHGGYRTAFEMPIPFAFRVAAADANGNGHPDIYVMRRRPGQVAGLPLRQRAELNRLHEPTGVGDMLLVSKGSYDEYEVIDLPLPPPEGGGVADDVLPIDHDRDGKWAFLVLNGMGKVPGRVQLIALS
jgi:FG-GAP-like repeat